MASSRSCNSSVSAIISRKKRCDCGEFMRLLTSHSTRNPERRFWRCSNWKIHEKKKKTRGHFQWEDETTSEDEGEDEYTPHLCQVCEVSKRTSGKVQKKLVYERRRWNMFVAGIVLSWTMTFGICLFSMLGGHFHG